MLPQARQILRGFVAFGRQQLISILQFCSVENTRSASEVAMRAVISRHTLGVVCTRYGPLVNSPSSLTNHGCLLFNVSRHLQASVRGVIPLDRITSHLLELPIPVIALGRCSKPTAPEIP